METLTFHQALVDRAAAEDRTMAATIRVAIRYYLANTTPATKETDG